MKRILEAPSRRVANIFNEVDVNFVEICNSIMKIAYPDYTLHNYAEPLNEPSAPSANDCYLVKEDGTVWDLTVEENDIILYNGASWEILTYKITEISAALLTELTAESAKIGDITGSNYSEIRTDGTQRLVGNATAWKDMIMDISGRNLNSTSGKVDYDWDNNAIIFQPGGSIATAADRVQGNQEINHEFKVGSSMTFKPHIHWFQEVISHTPDVLDTTPYIITLRYRLIRNGRGVDLTTPAWTTITCEMGSGGDDVFDVTLADGKEYIAQISRFDDIVIDCGVSDTLQVQMARTDSETGNIMVFFFDTHGQIDSFGSDEEITKAV